MHPHIETLEGTLIAGKNRLDDARDWIARHAGAVLSRRFHLTLDCSPNLSPRLYLHVCDFPSREEAMRWATTELPPGTFESEYHGGGAFLLFNLPDFSVYTHYHES